MAQELAKASSNKAFTHLPPSNCRCKLIKNWKPRPAWKLALASVSLKNSQQIIPN